MHSLNKITHTYLILAALMSFFCFPFAAYSENGSLKNDLEAAKQSYFSGEHQNALKLFIPIAEKGEAEAQYYLGLIYSTDPQKKNLSLALSYLLSAAEEKYASAMWHLGQMHENGEGGEKRLLIATDWYRKAEKHEHMLSTVQFLKEENGVQIKQATSNMISELQTVAEKGDIDAQFRLAKIYDSGKLTPTDIGKAWKWYLKAAKNGHDYSMYLVGYFYCRGIAVVKNSEKADHWFRKSERNIKCQ